MPVREKNCILLSVPTASEETMVCALFSSYLESHKNYVIVSVRVYMRVCASMCVRERGREGRRWRERLCVWRGGGGKAWKITRTKGRERQTKLHPKLQIYSWISTLICVCEINT